MNTTQYTLTATSPGGTAEVSMTVTVASAAPTAILDVMPSEISPGESFVLSWDSSCAEYAYLDNGIGEVAPSGSMTLSATQTTPYTLTVTGQGGCASAQVQVTVLGNPEPQPEGGFGSNYQDLIPADATLEAYDPKRFAVVVGSVQDASGVPLSGSRSIVSFCWFLET